MRANGPSHITSHMKEEGGSDDIRDQQGKSQQPATPRAPPPPSHPINLAKEVRVQGGAPHMRVPRPQTAPARTEADGHLLVSRPASRWGHVTSSSFTALNRKGWAQGRVPPGSAGQRSLHITAHHPSFSHDPDLPRPLSPPPAKPSPRSHSQTAARAWGSNRNPSAWQSNYLLAVRAGLAPSPLTEYLRGRATSTVAGQVPLAPLSRASGALTLSRSHSRIVREDDSPLSTPARNTHYPMPSDAQALVATVMSHEHGAGLKHKRVLALLGPLP